MTQRTRINRGYRESNTTERDRTAEWSKPRHRTLVRMSPLSFGLCGGDLAGVGIDDLGGGLVLLRPGRRAAAPDRLLEAIAVAVHGQDADVVGEPVQQGAGEPLRSQDGFPVLEREVRRDGRAPLVALREGLEEQLGSGWRKRPQPSSSTISSFTACRSRWILRRRRSSRASINWVTRDAAVVNATVKPFWQAASGGNALLVVDAVGGERGHRSRDLVEQGADLGAVIDLLCGQRRRDDLAGAGVQADVQLRQDRRVLVPCFSTSHSPAPQSFRPVLSTSRCRGSPSLRGHGRGTTSVSARRQRVVWSGTARVSPSRPMTEPIRPSVWRRGQAEHGPERECRQDRQRRTRVGRPGSRAAPPAMPRGLRP